MYPAGPGLAERGGLLCHYLYFDLYAMVAVPGWCWCSLVLCCATPANFLKYWLKGGSSAARDGSAQTLQNSSRIFFGGKSIMRKIISVAEDSSVLCYAWTTPRQSPGAGSSQDRHNILPPPLPWPPPAPPAINAVVLNNNYVQYNFWRGGGGLNWPKHLYIKKMFVFPQHKKAGLSWVSKFGLILQNVAVLKIAHWWILCLFRCGL